MDNPPRPAPDNAAPAPPPPCVPWPASSAVKTEGAQLCVLTPGPGAGQVPVSPPSSCCSQQVSCTHDMTTLETYLRCAAPLPSLVSLSPDSRWRAGYLATAAGFSRLGCSLFCHGSHMRLDTQPYLHRGGRQVDSGEWTLILRGRITNYNVC